MNDAATMVGYREIIVDEIFPHTPEAVWETLPLLVYTIVVFSAITSATCDY